jgi:hypothetical protein
MVVYSNKKLLLDNLVRSAANEEKVCNERHQATLLTGALSWIKPFSVLQIR